MNFNALEAFFSSRVHIHADAATLTDLFNLLNSLDFREEAIGSIKFWPMEDPPVGWVVCDGRKLDKDDYAELFALVGYKFGTGSGGQEFGVPPAQDRFVVVGDDVGGGYDIGDTGGSDNVTLTTSQIPSHRHGIEVSESRDAGAVRVQSTSTILNPAELDTEYKGGGNSHQNRPKYLALNLIIKAL